MTKKLLKRLRKNASNSQKGICQWNHIVKSLKKYAIALLAPFFCFCFWFSVTYFLFCFLSSFIFRSRMKQTRSQKNGHKKRFMFFGNRFSERQMRLLPWTVLRDHFLVFPLFWIENLGRGGWRFFVITYHSCRVGLAEFDSGPQNPKSPNDALYNPGLIHLICP